MIRCGTCGHGVMVREAFRSPRLPRRFFCSPGCLGGAVARLGERPGDHGPLREQLAGELAEDSEPGAVSFDLPG